MRRIIKVFAIFTLLFLVCSDKFLANEDSSSSSYAEQVKEASLQGPGTYPITFWYENDQGTKLEETKYLTITGPDTIINGDGIAINANPFTVSASEVKQLTVDDWIEKANAKAWNEKDGSYLAILEVDISDILTRKGTYQIRFKTFEEVETTVSVEVVGNYLSDEEIKVDNAEQLIDWDSIKMSRKLVLTAFIIFILFIPLIALLLQYQATKRLVKQIFSVLSKKEKR